MSRLPLAVLELGLVPYRAALALQRELREQRIGGVLDRDLLLLLQHPPTVTLGRGTRRESLPLSEAELVSRGQEVVEIERGGDVTWHGPGQLVGYPIIDLTGHRQDLHWYLRQVEELLIRGLDDLGIAAERRAGLTGVWTAGRKIASVGIHVRQWVTAHGFALNVHNDLTAFGLIVPCGIVNVEMTSIEREAARRSLPAPTWGNTVDAVVTAAGEVFDRDPVRLSDVEQLGLAATRSER